MSEERRYKDHEIREIFDLAIREDETQVESFSGLREPSLPTYVRHGARKELE